MASPTEFRREAGRCLCLSGMGLPSSYVSKDQFDEEEKEIVEEMLNHVDFIEANEALGLVACMEHYDMPYEFYILHIEG